MDRPDASWTQLPMFGRSAVALTLQALTDPDDRTVVIVVEAREAPGGRLRALWSTSPLPFEDYTAGRTDALREFSRLLFELTGPFA